jgi:protein-disulfide isomerase
VFGIAVLFGGIGSTVFAQSPVGPQSTPPVSSAPAAAPLTPGQVDQFERVIRDYLIRNPEVIIEAVQGLERRQRDEQAKAAQGELSARRGEILNDPGSPVGGNLKGDVTIVEFFDYRCPYCKRVAPSIAQLLKEDAKLRVVYKEFPILGPESMIAARAALAAHAQGKYARMHEALMNQRGNLDEAGVMRAAGEAGLDVNRLKADMKKPEIEEQIQKVHQLARALNINGTPAFIIGDRIVPGAVDLETLKTLVRQARQG